MVLEMFLWGAICRLLRANGQGDLQAAQKNGGKVVRF